MARLHGFHTRNRETRELERVEITTHPPRSKIVIDAKKAREEDVLLRLEDDDGSRGVTLDRIGMELLCNAAGEILQTMPRSEYDTVDRDGGGDRIFVTLENYSDLNMLELASGMDIRFGEFGGQLLETINLQPRARAKLVYTADGWRRERIIR